MQRKQVKCRTLVITPLGHRVLRAVECGTYVFKVRQTRNKYTGMFRPSKNVCAAQRPTNELPGLDMDAIYRTLGQRKAKCLTDDRSVD